MSNTKHTPGDWKATANGEIRAIQDGIEITIAAAYDLRHDDKGERQRANAALIAQAPAMYDLLVDAAFIMRKLNETHPFTLAAYGDTIGRFIADANEVIKQAKGE